MKQLITSTILLLALLLPALTYAHDFEVNGIYYNRININEVEVTFGRDRYLYYRYSGTVTIPATVTYDGTTYSVTKIGENAFSRSTGLTSVDIPNSVTEIGHHAFYGCTGLTSIDIPNSVTEIGVWAFVYNTGLTSIDIPNSVTAIGDYAFYYCSGLTSIVIPNSVKEVGVCAFMDCPGLTSIVVESGNPRYDSRDNCNAIIETANNVLIAGCKNTIIPNSVTAIGDDAFRGWTGLTSIDIPNSVTAIGAQAFEDCSGLTSIDIPNSVTAIGDYAFIWCPGLTSIVVESGNPRYDSRNNCNAIIETASNALIAGCKNTIIPNSVTAIGDGAFQDCDGLTSIVIPNSVTAIGAGAFEECSGLTSIVIPHSVTEIGDMAFAYCTGLTDVYCYIADPSRVSSGYEQFENGGYSGRTLHVQQGMADAYRTNRNWYPYFEQIVEDLFRGDVNGDHEVNIADVIVAINMILVGNGSTPADDVNGDGEINIADINTVIDIILSSNMD